MKNKAPLALMEQLIMLLVFALAAALCLQIYVFSAQLSRRCEAQSFAATEVQNVAEIMKKHRGDLSAFTGHADGAVLTLGYDENWKQVQPGDAVYRILVTLRETDIPGLGRATVAAQTAEGDGLFGVDVCWQEVRCE